MKAEGKEMLRALLIVAAVVGALVCASKVQLDIYDKQQPVPTPSVSATR